MIKVLFCNFKEMWYYHESYMLGFKLKVGENVCFFVLHSLVLQSEVMYILAFWFGNFIIDTSSKTLQFVEETRQTVDKI